MTRLIPVVVLIVAFTIFSVAHLALTAGCPVVPVGLQGTEDIQPVGSNRPRLRGVDVTVRFGEPITVEEFEATEEAGKEALRKAVEERYPGATLHIDGGDMMQGTLVSNLTAGRATIEAFAAIGVDAATKTVKLEVEDETGDVGGWSMGLISAMNVGTGLAMPRLM